MINKYSLIRFKFVIIVVLISVIPDILSSSVWAQNNNWVLAPFIKQDKINPCLSHDKKNAFICPVTGELTNWEEKDVFNPAAVVRNSKVYLLYRAEDKIGKHAGTSRIGIAESLDGLHFIKHSEPVLYPDKDFMKKYEWDGGCEDPRIVEDQNGQYYMTYTAYDGYKARLCIAISSDLFHWEKKGPVFEKTKAGKYRNMWSKSGSIICKRKGSKLVTIRINGKYWMYWGDRRIFIASSDNLIDWEPLEDDAGDFISIFSPRKTKFDSELVEAGPPAVMMDKGILFIYNSKNSNLNGDRKLAPGTYAAGQVLINPKNPRELLGRTDDYFLKPERSYEITGQVDNVCFLEGLVYFQKKWFLYYGTADSKIAVAICNP